MSNKKKTGKKYLLQAGAFVGGIIGKMAIDEAIKVVKSKFSYTVSINNYIVTRFIIKYFKEFYKKEIYDKISIIEDTDNPNMAGLGSVTTITDGCIIQFNASVDSVADSTFRTVKIIFIGPKARSKFIHFKKWVNETMEKEYNKIELRTLNTILPDDYTEFDITHDKSLDNIIMPVNDMTYIKSKLTNWQNISETLQPKGVSTCYGILLYGKPGTGKTSLATAIGKSLNRVIYDITVNFGTDKDSENLIRALRQHVRDKSVIIFNDCDTYLGNRYDGNSSKQDNQFINIMLQLLDGRYCKDLVIILTTNFKERLDPAIIRSGRINLEYEMKEFDEDVAIAMCNEFEVNPEEILKDETYPINPAYLQDKIISSMKL